MREEVIVIGGANREGEHFNDIWRFSEKDKVWRELKPKGDVLPKTSGHTAVTLGNSIFVFGGFNTQKGEVYNQMYKIDVGECTMLCIIIKSFLIL
jgi:N-acetylneuraminic acid mutarotase